jgi:toxin ParE1/3/4
VARELRIQSRARSDIVELAVFIGRHSANAADRFLDATDETFASLAEQPFLGAEYPTKNPRLNGIRVIRARGFPNQLAFYFVRSDEVEIVRVLHGARDLDAALDQ